MKFRRLRARWNRFGNRRNDMAIRHDLAFCNAEKTAEPLVYQVVV